MTLDPPEMRLEIDNKFRLPNAEGIFPYHLSIYLRFLLSHRFCGLATLIQRSNQLKVKVKLMNFS